MGEWICMIIIEPMFRVGQYSIGSIFIWLDIITEQSNNKNLEQDQDDINNDNCLFHQKHIYEGSYNGKCDKVKPTKKLLGSLFGTNKILDKRDKR